MVGVVKRDYSTTLTVDAQGRVLLPSPLRRALGLGPGSRLVALVEEGRLVLEPWERVEEELWRELADLEGSLSEELIRERRLEAERDG
uniref:AbrB/MazE/SpoVT family DNA-binding domain-containing protein n=1 Tax=Thermus caliditerrae TaxID=1330700 RepID=A0A7C5VIV5_9DEIN